MNDNEIIKALECCCESECEGCKYEYDTACKEYILHDCIRLIKQKQDEVKAYKHYYDECLKDLKKANTEIERLVAEQEEYPFKCKVGNNSEIHSKSIQDYNDLIKDIQTAAIEECLRRVRRHIKTYCNSYSKSILDFGTLIKIIDFIDNLEKEMVGEKNVD